MTKDTDADRPMFLADRVLAEKRKRDTEEFKDAEAYATAFIVGAGLAAMFGGALWIFM